MDTKPHLKTQQQSWRLTQHPMLQITAASNKHLLTKPLKFLKVLSWSSATPPKNTGQHQSCISPDNLNISSQTPVPQSLGDLIEKGIARKFYLSIIIERHIRHIIHKTSGNHCHHLISAGFQRKRLPFRTNR